MKSLHGVVITFSIRPTKVSAHVLCNNFLPDMSCTAECYRDEVRRKNKIFHYTPPTKLKGDILVEGCPSVFLYVRPSIDVGRYLKKTFFRISWKFTGMFNNAWVLTDWILVMVGCLFFLLAFYFVKMLLFGFVTLMSGQYFEIC